MAGDLIRIEPVREAHMLPAICSIAGCNKPVLNTRGWCSRHYQRWRIHGDPTAGQTSRGEARAEILRAVQSADKSACWMWRFNHVPKGYGQIHWAGRMTYAHRVVCALVHGEPPTPKHHAAHACGRSGCINPHHLSWKTPKANEADKLVHGTSQYGEGNGGSKLTNAAVADIICLRAAGTKQAELAARFGVSQSTISEVLSGKRWAHLRQEQGAV